MQRAAIAVGVKAERRGVARLHEILDVNVSNVNLLISAFPLVEPAIGLLLEEVEERRVVFDTTAAQRPEYANAWRFEHRHEATEIAAEFLDAGANGDEVVIGAQVRDLHLGESFLHPDMRRQAIGPAPHIKIDDGVFGSVEEVQAEGGLDPDSPVNGTIRGVAAKKIERRSNDGYRKRLAASTIEILAVLTGGGYTTRHRHVTRFEQ